MGSDVRRQETFERRWLFIAALFLIVDLAKPQSVMPIGFLRPGLITVVLLAIFLFYSRKASRFIEKQVLLILCFVALLAVYVLFAVNNFWAYQAFLTMALMVPLIISLQILMNSRERLISLLWIFTFITVFVGAYGLMHGGRGPGGNVLDENDLCLFLVTFLPFVFFLLSQQKQPLKRYILFSMILLLVLSSVSTSSRGGFVGLLAMGTVYWWYSKNKFLIIACAIMLVIAASLFGGETYRQDMSTVTNRNEGTAQIRLLSWGAAWRMFIDHPLGVGGNNFPVHFPDYQPPDFERSMWGRQAHSLWFTLISETGVVGILIYLAIIRLNFRDLKILRRQQLLSSGKTEGRFYFQLSVALLASFAGFFASASFLSVLYYPEFWYLTAIVVATKNLAENSLTNSESMY